MKTDTIPGRAGRPRGQHFDAVVHVRLPRPALEAIEELANRSKRSVAEIIRNGLIAALVQAVQPAAATAKDPAASPMARIEAMDLLRLVNTAGVFLGPTGLTIARSRAQEEETPNDSNELP